MPTAAMPYVDPSNLPRSTTDWDCVWKRICKVQKKLYAYSTALKEIIQYMVSISDVKMEEGSMRVDAAMVRKKLVPTSAENLNSFNFVRKGIEEKRQAEST